MTPLLACAGFLLGSTATGCLLLRREKLARTPPPAPAPES